MAKKKTQAVDGIELKGDIKIQMLGLAQIRPYNNNPRYNLKSILLLEEAIKKYGFLVPITVEPDFTIVTGHSRYNAARNLDLEEIPVIILDDLSERELREYRIADNKVGEFSQFDFEKMGERLKEYAKDDELMGFAFPKFAPDFTLDNNHKGDDNDDSEPQVLECICPSCLHEFDGNSGYPFDVDGNLEEE